MTDLDRRTNQSLSLACNWLNDGEVPASDRSLIALLEPCPSLGTRTISAAILLNLSPAGLGRVLTEQQQLMFDLGYECETGLQNDFHYGDFLHHTGRLESMKVPISLFQDGDYDGPPLPPEDERLFKSHETAGHTPGFLVPLARLSELSTEGMLYAMESISFQAWLFGNEWAELMLSTMSQQQGGQNHFN